MENYTNYIAKQITGTTKDKIVHALLKEFIACNSLHLVYNMSQTDMEKAFIEFKELVNSLPETLRFVEFD
ncbi:MAG: hypothetical protein ABIP27_12185 [Flavobacterium circumlabens]|uniref:hypothetical protein n=1 Tax=Flavobacterium circumlabens TaxID=2133765 RepID=UPI003263273B